MIIKTHFFGILNRIFLGRGAKGLRIPRPVSGHTRISGIRAKYYTQKGDLDSHIPYFLNYNRFPKNYILFRPNC